ncbi:fumarylacetoacetate hydrolase family protein [Streptacidiphilus sp. P02-A3a]|uniref:fumarylacetoacetate hydrolase family protein n=1 Tax=Streptacidiphilus sp. P02-A3a TaxID=2704468 RepID=UPI0015F975BA|nr:fumarylacetoacetate hydrolase family protein [Streptacidiphilus sp. P02-A3a]QMU71549.1 fumarylacetoacetate hydrolase family protein [Streptacidiphilus sp. P02-A3a]
MKLLRYGQPGRERAGVLDRDGRVRDLSALHSDIRAESLSPEVLDRLRGIDPASLPLVDAAERIGPCVSGVSKVVCIGLNYRDHANETGKPIPTEPVVFMKATTSISGPNDDVVLPRDAEKGDWEVELGIVIGRKAQYVAEEDWLSHVAGFCVVNDVSERAFQVERGGQWVKGKSSDTFCPLGPWLVTPDEVPDPQALELVAEVSGEIMQEGSTSDMIFSCAEIVSYVSRFMTLLPGDVIATGTPAGVGFARNRFLKPGDSMRLSVSGLGEQYQRVVAYEDSAR